MLMVIASLALALQVSPGHEITPPVEQIQYRVPVRPPPCGDHWDLSARDGLCYPNGYLPPQDQAALQGRYYRPDYGYRRRPVPCTDGADRDIRDGLCYPNGTVPERFQSALQGYYGYPPPRPRYYYRD